MRIFSGMRIITKHLHIHDCMHIVSSQARTLELNPKLPLVSSQARTLELNPKLPLVSSQARTQALPLAEAKKSPSLEKVTALTDASWPLNTPKAVIVIGSHNRT
jgi:hypothetical protein